MSTQTCGRLAADFVLVDAVINVIGIVVRRRFDRRWPEPEDSIQHPRRYPEPASPMIVLTALEWQHRIHGHVERDVLAAVLKGPLAIGEQVSRRLRLLAMPHIRRMLLEALRQDLLASW